MLLWIERFHVKHALFQLINETFVNLDQFVDISWPIENEVTLTFMQQWIIQTDKFQEKLDL